MDLSGDMPAPFNPSQDLGDDMPAPFNPFGETAAEPPRARTGAGQSPAPFDPANLDVMPPMGGDGFVQAGPGSLFSLSDVPEPTRPPASRGRGNQPVFPSDLPDVDLQPFDGGLEDIPGLNEPNSFRGTLDSLSDEPFYPQPRPRPRSLEPELEAEPGHEKPLKNFVWMKDRAQKRRDDEEDARDNNAGKSLFDKLAEKRRREAPPPVQEPAARLESFAAQEVDQLGDYMSFDEIERQATKLEQPQSPAPSISVPPPASIQPPAPVLDETPDFNFDFLNSAEAAPPSSRPPEIFEPFSLDMDDSAISSPDKFAPFSLEPEATSGSSSPAAPFSFDLGEEEGAKASAAELFSFDLDEEESVSTPPFSFSLDDEESGATAPFSFDLGEEAKPTSTSQSPAPFSFDLGEEARPTSTPQPPAPFSFDLGTDDSAKATPQPPAPFSFDLGEDSNSKSAPSPTATPFSFDLGTDDSAKATPPTPFSFDLGFDKPDVPPPSVSDQRRLEPEPNFDFGKPRPPEPLMPEATPFAFNLDSGTAAEKPAPFSFDLEEAAPPAFLQDLKPNEGFSWNEPGATDKAAMPLPDFDFDGSNSPAPGLKQPEAVSSPEIPDFAFEPASPTPPTSAEPFAFDLGAIAPPTPSPKRTEPVFDTSFNIDEPTSPPPPKPAEGKPVLPDFDFEVAKPGPSPAFVVEPNSASVRPVLEPVAPINRAEAVGSGNGSRNDTASYLGRVRQNPRDLEANLQLANTYFEQSKFSEAITHYNSAIRVADPETLTGLVSRLEKIAASEVNPRFHRVLGDAYMKQGQYHWALSEYSKALGTIGAKK